MKQQMSSIRKKTFIMRVLNTFYPLGLNDRQLGGGCVSNNHTSTADHLYFSTPIPRRKRSHGVRRSGRKKADSNNEHLHKLESLRELFEDCKTVEFYKLLKSIKDNVLRFMYNTLKTCNNLFACIFTSYYFSRFNNNSVQKSPNTRMFLVFNFNCRNVDLLNLTSVVGDKRIYGLLPEALHEQFPPRVFFKLRKPISLEVCNYSKLLKSLSIMDIKDIISSKCCCNDYNQFICDPYGHVFTGDLNLIEDVALKEIVKFGSKFKVEHFLTWDKVLLSLEDDLYDNAFRLAKKSKVSFDSFLPWLNKISEVILLRVLKFKKLHKCHNNAPSLNDTKHALANLHEKFVVCTVDKASNNFAFVCKKFFVLVLLEELGFDKDNFLPIGNNTYLPVWETENDIINRHSTVLNDNFKMNCTIDNRVLPRLFWVPKLHKNPFKFRFIAGARHCTTKPLSIVVNQGLSVVKESFRKYCGAILRNSGFNFFWSINSTLEFLNKIKDIKVWSLQVFDFSTLYTNIDQTAILQHLYSLLDLVFNTSSRKFLCIRYDRCFFSSKQYTSYACFDLHLFKEAIRFVISEVFVSFGGLVFKQIRGIPMGGNCSPLLADLFLAHCEFLFMSKLVKENKFGLAKLLSNTSRYIDDLCFVNYKHFETIIHKIYPVDLAVDRSGDDNNTVDYLDVKLVIQDNELHTSVFHKVDNFNFPVILLTFPNSLIPLKMGYNVYAGQVLRYMRICSNLEDFINKTLSTTLLLIKRGYDKRELQFYLEKFLSRHNSLLRKFGFFSSRQVSSLIDF